MNDIFYFISPRKNSHSRRRKSLLFVETNILECSSRFWKKWKFEEGGSGDLEFQSRNSIESRTCAIKECRWHPFETKINLFNYVVIEETCNYKQSAQSLVATTYGRLARIFESRITKRCVQIIFQYKDFSVIKRGEEKYIARKMRSSRASRQTEREREILFRRNVFLDSRLERSQSAATLLFLENERIFVPPCCVNCGRRFRGGELR